VLAGRVTLSTSVLQALLYVGLLMGVKVCWVRDIVKVYF